MAHLHNGKDTVGLQKKERKKAPCKVQATFAPRVSCMTAFHHRSADATGKTGHSSGRFSQLTLGEVGRTISWLRHNTVTLTQLLLG